MKWTWKQAAAVLFYLMGILGWCYVGGYLSLTRPIRGLFLAYFAKELTLWKVFIAAIQVFLYLTAGGAVWCLGYILSGYFRDYDSKE